VAESTKAWGREGIGQRIGRDKIFFSYWDEDVRVRRTISKSLLTEFLTNGQNRDSNLSAGAESLTLQKFLMDHYLPRCAQPRLPNPRSFKAETDLSRALIKTLGNTPLHALGSSDAEMHKANRLADACANNSIKKELRCLSRAMDFAVSMELVRKNPLQPVRGLPSADRSSIWLKLPEIARLLTACPGRLSALVEFMIFTGARIGEALLVEASDIRSDSGVILVPTEKRKCPPRDCMRKLDIESLGPRFKPLLSRLEAQGNSGRLFPLTYPGFSGLFAAAREKAKLDHIHAHDLRGTFAVHRALVVKSFRQLQAELGHRDSKSVESYLDRAEQFDPKQSIFYAPPIQLARPTTPPTPSPSGTHPNMSDSDDVHQQPLIH
jgi:integrase